LGWGLWSRRLHRRRAVEEEARGAETDSEFDAEEEFSGTLGAGGAAVGGDVRAVPGHFGISWRESREECGSVGR
jgi:hypothetical protein